MAFYIKESMRTDIKQVLIIDYCHLKIFHWIFNDNPSYIPPPPLTEYFKMVPLTCSLFMKEDCLYDSGILAIYI